MAVIVAAVVDYRDIVVVLARDKEGRFGDKLEERVMLTTVVEKVGNPLVAGRQTGCRDLRLQVPSSRDCWCVQYACTVSCILLCVLGR